MKYPIYIQFLICHIKHSIVFVSCQLFLHVNIFTLTNYVLCNFVSSKKQKKMIQAEEHEVSSISTVTEADDLRSSCSKGFSDCTQTAEHGSFSQILHNKDLLCFLP